MNIKSNKKIEIPLYYERLQNILDTLLQKKVVAKKTEFARILGKSLISLNTAFYKKETNPKISTILNLVEAFNVNLLYFFYEEAPMFQEEKVETKQTFETDREEQLYNQVVELKKAIEEIKAEKEAEKEKAQAAARLLLTPISK